MCVLSSLRNTLHVSNHSCFFLSAWSNNEQFPPKKVDAQGNAISPGFDPLIGQKGNDAREVKGMDVDDQQENLPLPAHFIVPLGGEYIFIPSIATLRDDFALAVSIQS
jgi:hypothetical protein